MFENSMWVMPPEWKDGMPLEEHATAVYYMGASDQPVARWVRDQDFNPDVVAPLVLPS